VELNLAEFDVVPDRKGRNNTICVILSKMRFNMISKRLLLKRRKWKNLTKGRFFLDEIDSPGGKTNLPNGCVPRYQYRNCRTVAFVNGGVTAEPIQPPPP
jgi:hypothetical protein